MSEKIDLYAEHAKEKFSLPSDWRIYRWACGPSGADEPTFINLSGVVCPDKSKGKSKGCPAWSKGDKSTDCTVTLTINEHEAWKLEWENRTGKCHECTGSGEVLLSWSATEGVKNRVCPRCNGMKTASIAGLKVASGGISA